MGNNSVPKCIFRLSRFTVYGGSVLGRFYCISNYTPARARVCVCAMCNDSTEGRQGEQLAREASHSSPPPLVAMQHRYPGGHLSPHKVHRVGSKRVPGTTSSEY